MHLRKIATSLRLARKERGLSNQDLAHLLAIDGSRISRIERGRVEPNATELLGFALIYGHQPDRLLEDHRQELAEAIHARFMQMPPTPYNWKMAKERQRCVDALSDRLQALMLPVYEA